MKMFQRKQVDDREPFDVAVLEREISTEMRRNHPQVTFVPQPVLIEQPQVTAEDLARITGEAIVKAHEAAIKSLDGLCNDMKMIVENIELLKVTAMQNVKDVEELCAAYRDKGKLMAVKVESATLGAQTIRDKIEDLRTELTKP